MKYYCIVRVYPKIQLTDKYNFGSHTYEFQLMDFYDNWKKYRTDGDIKEDIDVFVKKDLTRDDIIAVKNKFEALSKEHFNKVLAAKDKYFKSPRNQGDNETYESEIKTAKTELNEAFDTYLTSDFSKEDFS